MNLPDAMSANDNNQLVPALVLLCNTSSVTGRLEKISVTLLHATATNILEISNDVGELAPERHCTELATCEKTEFALEPISRTVPTTKTRITASITAYSAISWP